jgi:hypothetical protein
VHLVGILFPHIIDDARSKPHQIYDHVVPKSLFRIIPSLLATPSAIGALYK